MPEVSVPDLQPVGATVPAVDITVTAVVSLTLSFGLAVFPSLASATYPAISTDSGANWRIAGPEFYVAAAQGANVTSEIGALPPNGSYAWGQGGNAVKVTTDRGDHWWGTGFAFGVYRVSASDGTLDVVALGPQSEDGSFAAYLYVSTDSGHTWHLHGQLPNVRLAGGPVLGSDGLGIVGMGTTQTVAVADMAPYLGSPTTTTSGVCKNTTEVQWGDLSLEFTTGRLTGYRYLRGGLAAVGTSPRPTGSGDPSLMTATGATLGMTLSQVRSLYPPGDFSQEQGGAIVVPGTTTGDRLFLGFFASHPSTPLTEVKGGSPCGDF